MITREEIDKLCEEYSRIQIDSAYNEIPVCWCRECKSLLIGYLESKLVNLPELYCIHCNSFEVTSGTIFEWLKLVTPETRIFKNLDELKKYQRRVENCVTGNLTWTDEDENIRREIEEEIESLYRY